jgi:hypothetical protein
VLKEMDSMDQRAIKILMDSYWTSAGWRDAPITSPEDLAYAKNAGVMFDAIRVSHAEIVRRALDVRDRVDPQAVATAFLASLSTRRLELRSALGSYAVLRYFPEHQLDPATKRCPICGAWDDPTDDHDLSMLNFERFKWGGVRHSEPLYGAFDLDEFLRIEPVIPKEADLDILQNVLKTAAQAAPKTTARQLQGLLRNILPSEREEREILITILGYTGILAAPEHPGFHDRFIPADKRELPPRFSAANTYPACWWRGEYGINREAVRNWFPGLE